MEAPEHFCIYCFRTCEDNMSKSHLFPQSIGGRVHANYTCGKCNSLIGTRFEADIKKSLFLVMGISKLGIAPADKALQRISKTDLKTGQPLRLEGDVLKALTTYDPLTGNIAGTKDGVKKKLLEIVRKKYPQYEEQVRKEFGAETGELITLPDGTEYLVSGHTIDNRYVRLQGQVRFPDALLAKIAFESMWLLWPFSRESVREFFLSTFALYGQVGGLTDIRLKPNFVNRIRMLDKGPLTGKVSYEDAEYYRFHQINFRISASGTAYMRINFFEAASFIIVIEKTVRAACVVPEHLDCRHIFPIDRCVIEQVDKSDYGTKFSAMEDAAADACFAKWQEFVQKQSV